MATRSSSISTYIDERVDVDENGCWNWTLALNSRGYGLCFRRDWRGLAHRFAYTHLVDEIPEGGEIDHLCMNKACVNPAHLEVVSAKVNSRRQRHHHLGRNFSVYQSAGYWCAVASDGAGANRHRKSFRSRSREVAVAKIEEWLSATR